jgi:hypothetical protein
MNRQQKIDALVSSGVAHVLEVERHQWLGIIRSLLNILLSSMTDEQLQEVYDDVIGSEQKPKVS